MLFPPSGDRVNKKRKNYYYNLFCNLSLKKILNLNKKVIEKIEKYKEKNDPRFFLDSSDPLDNIRDIKKRVFCYREKIYIEVLALEKNETINNVNYVDLEKYTNDYVHFHYPLQKNPFLGKYPPFPAIIWDSDTIWFDKYVKALKYHGFYFLNDIYLCSAVLYSEQIGNYDYMAYKLGLTNIEPKNYKEAVDNKYFIQLLDIDAFTAFMAGNFLFLGINFRTSQNRVNTIINFQNLINIFFISNYSYYLKDIIFMQNSPVFPKYSTWERSFSKKQIFEFYFVGFWSSFEYLVLFFQNDFYTFSYFYLYYVNLLELTFSQFFDFTMSFCELFKNMSLTCSKADVYKKYLQNRGFFDYVFPLPENFDFLVNKNTTQEISYFLDQRYNTISIFENISSFVVGPVIAQCPLTLPGIRFIFPIRTIGFYPGPFFGQLMSSTTFELYCLISFYINSWLKHHNSTQGYKIKITWIYKSLNSLFDKSLDKLLTYNFDQILNISQESGIQFEYEQGNFKPKQHFPAIGHNKTKAIPFKSTQKKVDDPLAYEEVINIFSNFQRCESISFDSNTSYLDIYNDIMQSTTAKQTFLKDNYPALNFPFSIQFDITCLDPKIKVKTESPLDLKQEAQLPRSKISRIRLLDKQKRNLFEFLLNNLSFLYYSNNDESLNKLELNNRKIYKNNKFFYLPCPPKGEKATPFF